MAIVIEDGRKLTRREELECEIALLIEESVRSDQDVSPFELAGLILELIEEETGSTFNG
ncbi:hypothetical protein [Rhizobium paknamense]|uniref:Uncharacterized protein n=1 Tax=Rhizobium paknamense TaxID=1206817 RepID=A0ABU0IAA6_9HYPH|nr:hypothetical protein [Rhizobium paknamense]MDQ0455160.1 hypothetical protein [Rhizobium paknamense]